MEKTGFALGVAALVLSGCALNMRLLEDGKVHRGTFDPAGRKMDVTIEGDRFAGSVSQGMMVGFGQTFTGTRMSTGTMVMGSGQFQGVLTNAAGKVLRCQFQSAMGRGQGMCQNNDGRTFDLVVGDDGTSGTFVKSTQ